MPTKKSKKKVEEVTVAMDEAVPQEEPVKPPRTLEEFLSGKVYTFFDRHIYSLPVITTGRRYEVMVANEGQEMLGDIIPKSRRWLVECGFLLTTFDHPALRAKFDGPFEGVVEGYLVWQLIFGDCGCGSQGRL